MAATKDMVVVANMMPKYRLPLVSKWLMIGECELPDSLLNRHAWMTVKLKRTTGHVHGQIEDPRLGP